MGDVLIAYLNALSRCEVYTPEQALFDFAFGVASELVGEALGNLVAKHGRQAVAAGLRKLGLDEAAEKLMRQADEVVDDVVPSPNICSFSEETLVATEDGYVPISDVGIGDYVLAYDEATGEIGYYPVTAVWAHEDPVIVYLTIDSETIETTPEHPFYTTDGEWVPAGELQAGSEVYKADGSHGVVENVAFVYQLQPMYNLTVATAHTYFVGDSQWLVHNSCPNVSRYKPSDAAALAQFADEVTSIQSARGMDSFGTTWTMWPQIVAPENFFVHKVGDRITGAMVVRNLDDALKITNLEGLGGGAGTNLMKTAAQESIARGYNGRMVLFASEQATGFYEKMGGVLVDPAQNEYFWDEAAAQILLGR